MAKSTQVQIEALWFQYLKPRLPIWLPSLVAFFLYLPAVHGGLVWDDPLFLQHPLYRDPAGWVEALSRPFLLSPNYYRPLAVASFLLSGSAPVINHLVSIALHALNSALVAGLAFWRMSRPSTGSRGYFLALAAGLIYGSHPVLIEGVAFISGRFDLMATAFLLLTLLVETHPPDHRWVRSLIAGLTVFLAALSKEMAVAIVLVLPLWHLSLRVRPNPVLDQATNERAETRGSSWLERLKLVLEVNWPAYLGVALAVLGYLGLRYFNLGYLYAPESGRALDPGSILQHLLLVGRSLSQYVLLTLWPFGLLAPIHHSPLPIPLSDLAAWASLALSLLISYGLLLWIQRDPESGWLAAGAVVALAPVLNLLPLELGGGAFVAERFLVFPLSLIVVAVVLLVARKGVQFVFALVGIWMVAALATVQVTVPRWRSDQALWEWALRRAPLSATPYTNLALEAVDQGDSSRALALAERALQLDPRSANAHDQRGLALFHLGRFKEAELAFAQAVALEADHGLYWSNLAGALREQGRLAEAERLLLEEALRLDPLLGTAHFNLGLVYLSADRPDLANSALRRAIDLLPPARALEVQSFLAQTGDPARWLRLGDLLLSLEDPQGALDAYDQAEQLGSRALDLAVGRSAARIELGELDQAEALLQAAMMSAPEDPRLHNNLGLIAHARGDLQAAREHFERAIELAPEWDGPRKNLDTLER